jgi:hypothetical protein
MQEGRPLFSKGKKQERKKPRKKDSYLRQVLYINPDINGGATENI